MLTLHHNIKAVLFDKDGTIMDSERVNCETYIAVAQSLGYEFTADMFQAFIGVPTLECYALLQTRYGPLFPLPRFIEQVKARMKQHKQVGLPLKQGFTSFLSFLMQQNIPAAIVTSASRESALSSLRPFEFSKHFEFVLTIDDVQQPKPAPECYRLACQRLGLLPQEVLVFEDSNHGIASALAANCHTIAIPDSQTIDAKLARKCLAVIDSFDDAYHYIKA